MKPKEHRVNNIDEIPSQEISDPAVLSKTPLVSVNIVTYNHEPYIAQAIEGALMQKTNFPYEILIGEDDSSDGTRKICKEYAAKHPDKIRLFLNDRKNVIYINGRPTGRWNFINLLKNAKGSYIALCEGDDYWTDPYKFQKQVDFLEANPDFSICSHNVLVKYEGQNKPAKEWLGKKQKGIIAIEELLAMGSGGATCSLVFRKDALDDPPDWFYKAQSGDTALQTLCVSKGKMKYFKELMGVYRRNYGGISVIATDSQANIDRFEAQVRTQKAINKYFHYCYDKSTRKHLVSYLYPCLVRSYLHNAIRIIAGVNKYARIIVKEDTDVYHSSFVEKVKYTLLIIITSAAITLHKIAKRLRKLYKRVL